jgi:hypothetical protein
MKRIGATSMTVQAIVLVSLFCLARPVCAAEADLIVHNGKIVTVDSDFSIRQAMAVKGNRILRLGNNEDVLQLKTSRTKVLDVRGKMVLPGLIDSHVHPCEACMTEFDHPIGQMNSIQDVLDYITAFRIIQ